MLHTLCNFYPDRVNTTVPRVVGLFQMHFDGTLILLYFVDMATTYTYVPSWFDPSTLPWRFGLCFPNVHNGRNVPEGMNWPKSARSQNQPQVSWCVKFAPLDEYSGLSMMVQCGSADATRMGLVECVLSAPTHPSLKLLV